MPISREERDQQYVESAQGPLQKQFREAETSYPPEVINTEIPSSLPGEKFVSIKDQGPTANRGFGSRMTVPVRNEGQ